MALTRLDISTGDGVNKDVKIVVDGHDITNSTTALSLEMSAGDITKATISVLVGKLSIDGDAEVLFDRIDPRERTTFASRFREFRKGLFRR